MSEKVPPRELDQDDAEAALDSAQVTASHGGQVDNKGPHTPVANSRCTLVNNTCNMETSRQEVKTATRGLPEIQNLDTDCKRFVRGGCRSRNYAGVVTYPHVT